MRVLIVFLLIVFVSCSFKKSYSFMADHIFKEFANEMKQKNGFQIVSTGGSMTNRDVKSVNMTFTSTYQFDIPQARKLYIETLSKLLDKINNDKIIRPYLHQYPANWENIDLGITFHGLHGHDVDDGKVSLMFVAKNKLCFFIKDSKMNEGERVYREPLEEALKIVFGDDFCNLTNKE